MTEPTLNYLLCPDGGAGHRMAYWQWGNPQAQRTVLCVHGLSRQGRDFDVLARSLVQSSEDNLRVVCPDVVGRGQSDWLADPAGYQLPTYVADMLHLLRHLEATTVDWIGTSMGGLIGLGVCAHASAVGARVRKLVLNDVGPVVQWDSLVRIASYLGRTMQFASMQQAAEALWSISSSFGPHSEAQWLELCRHMVKPLPQGQSGVALHYDPAIAIPVRNLTQETASQGEAALWQIYDGITAQTLLLRGMESDLLSPATALQMTVRGPKARLVEFAGVGHAPTLIADDQVQAITAFLMD